jgi:putative protease
MQINLELLAPARNAEIGIAAIDCGADAVYIAGPAFGARAAAGNPVEEIGRLCRHAHLYGARIFATVNTLLQGGELQEAQQLMWALADAGVDVFIIQDLNLLSLDLPPVELHASTQTAIRTPERARELEALGFTRLVLERQLTLEQIRAIRAAVSCELEFFIHGALCVGYSGQCYLSRQLTGRSANRGVCAQVCRSRYDLVDASGRVLVRDRTLLSPKDLRFDTRLADLVEAGITSFKIEGRLKNASYVKNVVRHYRNVIDDFIAASPMLDETAGVMPGLTGHLYRRASFGRLEGGFTPDPDRTFTRGWTTAFLDDRTESLASVDAAKALGEPVGEIVAVRGRDIIIRGASRSGDTLRSGRPLVNGDGLSFVLPNGEITGARAEVVQGDRVTLRDTTGLTPGIRVYRNFDVAFERELERNTPRRVIDVALTWRSGESGMTVVTAVTEDGLVAERRFRDEAPVAEKPEAALESLRRQLSKHAGPFAFTVQTVEADPVRFYSAAFLNQLRRDLADELQTLAETRPRRAVPHTRHPAAGALNLSTLDIPRELLRSRYCIRWELGLCPKATLADVRCPVKPGMTPMVNAGHDGRVKPSMTDGRHPRPDRGSVHEPLYLVNQGNRLRLRFDCAHCEMIVERPE